MACEACAWRSVGWIVVLVTWLSAAGCGSNSGIEADAALSPDAGPVVTPDAATLDAGPDARIVETCGFTYDQDFVYPSQQESLPAPSSGAAPAPRRVTIEQAPSDHIAHAEPPPDTTWPMSSAVHGLRKDPPDLVMPGYTDNMPLFGRAGEWTSETRCYELPSGAALLTQPEAYELYRDIAELTTGVALNDTPGARTVVGLRGGYPGTFAHHGNRPDRFNDTLVLLWIDDAGDPNVREFPVNTDTGVYDFGVDSSSSLRMNRRYHYVNSWHNTYNALHIDEQSYLVRDDTNNNGFWDSDRNGWLPPLGEDDYERTGSGHNIHMGSRDAPLGTAVVGVWSAGCQVIPGMANWTEFIYNAWTDLNTPLNYFLVDVRDIDPRVWAPCTPDGTHDCPHVVEGFPFVHVADTATVATREFDLYNCSTANESGPEVVYLFTVDTTGTLNVAVDDVDGDAVDVDVHLLDADDPSSCLDRADISFNRTLGPGRYFIVVDTYVEGTTELSGPYTLTLDFQ
jgi:hypothetical protein